MPMFYLTLPLLFIKFWFLDAPISLIRYFISLNSVVLQILSLSLLIKTFFKPLKNEYRKGLVGFSILFGVILKSVLIFSELLIFLVVIFFEILFLILFIFLPLIMVYLLFI